VSSTATRRVIVAWGPVVAYMGLIFALSSMPGGPKWLPLFPFADKGAHFVEYGGLGFLASRAARLSFPGKTAARLVAFSSLISVGFAISDELHQAFVPGRRGGDVGDLTADAIGALVGAVVYALGARAFASRVARVSRP
jgi:VanZ family protein